MVTSSGKGGLVVWRCLPGSTTSHPALKTACAGKPRVLRASVPPGEFASGDPDNIANPDKAAVKYPGSYSAVASRGVITARPK